MEQSSLYNKSFFGGDQELILFKIPDFELRLKNFEKEKYDNKIENIDKEIETIKDSLEYNICDDTPNFPVIMEKSIDNPFDTLQLSNENFLKQKMPTENYIINSENVD